VARLLRAAEIAVGILALVGSLVLLWDVFLLWDYTWFWETEALALPALPLALATFVPAIGLLRHRWWGCAVWPVLAAVPIHALYSASPNSGTYLVWDVTPGGLMAGAALGGVVAGLCVLLLLARASIRLQRVSRSLAEHDPPDPTS
jgi:hypothetical protein